MAEMSSLEVVTGIGLQLSGVSRPSKDFLVKSLRAAANSLSQLQQPDMEIPVSKKSESKDLENSMKLLAKSLIKHGLLNHKDKDVSLLVGVCVSDLFRILAPQPPFEDRHLRGVFELFISMFADLGDTSSTYFTKKVKVLETVTRCQCCVIMLDIGCNDLIAKMFDVFFTVARDHHQHSLLNNMLSIMVIILKEETSQPLVDVILKNLTLRGTAPCLAASRLATSVIQSCADVLEPFICSFLISCFFGKDSVEGELKESYHDILCKTFECAPQMLLSVIPSLVHELGTDQVDVRMKAVAMIGKLILMRSDLFVKEYKNLFMEFKNRFFDKSVEVRLTAIQCAKACYVANPSGTVSRELLNAVEGRLLDFEDRVRSLAVVVICDLVQTNIKLFPRDVISSAIERLRDKKMPVRKKALQKLMGLYRYYCEKCLEGYTTSWEIFEQIPCKILMLYFDKDCKEFRSEHLEAIITEELFPLSLSHEERTRHWINMFSLFKPLNEKALHIILSRKRRLQMEMRGYLSLRKEEKNGNQEKTTTDLVHSFSMMSTFFSDPSEAINGFKKLNELKNDKIFDVLEQLLDEWSIERAQLLKASFVNMLEDSEQLSDFTKELSTKCLFNIFGKETISYIINRMLSDESSKENIDDASIKLLNAILINFPMLLSGTEKLYLDLVKKKPNAHCLLQHLAKGSSYISAEFSALYPVLEQMCREGSREQAKCAVSSIALLAGSSLPKVFSKLCKELLKSLYRGMNAPGLLQSLGCIAQYCVPAFEGIYDDVVKHFYKDIFCKTGRRGSIASSLSDLSTAPGTSGCCDPCSLKIYGLKVLVKSFLPNQNFHINRDVQKLVKLFASMLQTDDTLDGMMSCKKDRQRLRYTAVKSLLRLSRRWDMQISSDAFRSAVFFAKDDSLAPTFLAKTHKMLMERAIPGRFSCAFALASSASSTELRNTAREYMENYVNESVGNSKILPFSAESNELNTQYPAYVVVFLLHVLAHDPEFPAESLHCVEELAAFMRPLFWVLQVLLNCRTLSSDAKLKSDTALYLLSVLKALKRAEDAVDPQVTPKLQLLADFGTAFVKSLHENDIPSSNAPPVVLLPSSLYKIRLNKKPTHGESMSPTITMEDTVAERVLTTLGSQMSMNKCEMKSVKATDAFEGKRKRALYEAENLQEDRSSVLNCCISVSSGDSLNTNSAKNSNVGRLTRSQTKRLSSFSNSDKVAQPDSCELIDEILTADCKGSVMGENSSQSPLQEPNCVEPLKSKIKSSNMRRVSRRR